MAIINIPDNPNPAPNYTYRATFANPLNLDANDSNSFYCLVTGDTVINLVNSRLGATYLIQLVIDDTGGYTIEMGRKFRGVIGAGTIDNTAGAVTLISVFRTAGGYLTYSILSPTIMSTTTSTTTTV